MDAGTELGLGVRGGGAKVQTFFFFFFETPNKYTSRRKMLYPQYFHNKSKVVGYYWLL